MLTSDPKIEDKLRRQAEHNGHELGQDFAPAQGGLLLESKCRYCGAWGLYSPDSGVITGGVVGSPCPKPL